MKKYIYFFVVLLIGILWYSCKEEGRLDIIDKNAPAPVQVSDVKVEATPGGAVLTYLVPKDANLAYMKAVYEIQPGVFREARSSIYTDTLALVGYGDTLSHEVKIFSVGKNEKTSEPFSIMITPLTPPVKTVFDDLKFVATFGGVRVDFLNRSQANVSIVVMVDSTNQGIWKPVTTFYTKLDSGTFKARGFAAKEMKFALFVRDRWNNKSDTLIKMLTPIFEQKIPKPFAKLVLPTDETSTAGPTYFIEELWDDVLSTSYVSSNSAKLPQWITLDLKCKVLLSSMKFHQTSANHLYYGSGLKTAEVWGSSAPNANGSWGSWQYLGTFHSFKPSGLPMGVTNYTTADKQYAFIDGEDFDFDTSTVVRYIRIKSLESYSSAGQIVIEELDFFGQIQP